MPARLEKLEIDEISIVDVPAHRPATVAVQKAERRERARERSEKLAKALSIDIWASFYNIYDEYDLEYALATLARIQNVELPTIARMIRDQAEALDLGEQLPTDGAFATLVMKRNNPGTEETMPVEKKEGDVPANEKLQLENERLKKELAASEAARKALVEKAKGDPEPTPQEKQAHLVIYKAADGTEYRDAESATLAKKLDDERADRDLEKRAAKFGYLPGDLEQHKSVIKALDTIPDEAQRGKAFEMLKSQNDELAKAFKSYGDAGNPANIDTDRVKEFEDLVKKHSEETGQNYRLSRQAVAKSNPGLAREIASVS